MQELAALTRLKSLTLLPCASITAVGLLHLTQLTGLTYLRVNDDISAEGWDGGALDAFKHDGGLVMWGAGPFPDVWRQLLTWCKRNTHCLHKMLEEQQQLVWLQAQQLQQQAPQLHGAQLRVMQLEQQLAAAAAAASAQNASFSANMLGAQRPAALMQQQLAAGGAGYSTRTMPGASPAGAPIVQQLALLERAEAPGTFRLAAPPAETLMQQQLAAAGPPSSSILGVPPGGEPLHQQLAAAVAGPASGSTLCVPLAGGALQQQLAAARAENLRGSMPYAAPAGDMYRLPCV